MKIVMSEQAQQWFTNEMQADENSSVRFYVRYGGSSPLHEGFSLGVSIDEPDEPAVTVTENGVLFFIEERDLWFFDGHDLHVALDEKRDEPTYDYVAPAAST